MNTRGFTVIELLISAAIFSIVLTGLTIAFMQQQRQSNITQEDIDLEQTARASLNYIATGIRNATSRQGKTFSLKFFNGGSTAAGCSGANTGNPGTVNSPPDCLIVYTWDITKGEDTTKAASPLAPRFPSSPAAVSVVSPGPPLVLQLPSDWFPTGGTPLIATNDLIGFRSRINLCSPDTTVNCGANPDKCTECSAVLKVSSVNSNTMQATINDSTALIKEQNFPVTGFSNMASFINGLAVNGIKYGFIPTISAQNSEMTIVQSTAISVDTTSVGTNAKQLEIAQNGSNTVQPVAGGADAPGIVDVQFVFNLQDADGGITKVGVCSTTSCKDTAKRMFSDFSADPSLLGRQKDIRSVEIYLLVRSRVKTPLIRGKSIPVGTIPAIGDVPQRTTSLTSDTFPNLGAGFMYRIFSTTIYIRNMAREDFG